jgi:hypothetical protein
MIQQQRNRQDQRKKAHKAKQRKQQLETPRFHLGETHGAGPAALGLRVGFPANRTVELDYASMTYCSSGSGTIGLYQFRLNSAFDPDYTGTGHQPMGFDQWAAYYNHYVVEACAYEISINTAPNAGTCTRAFVHLSDDPTIPQTDFTDLVELGAQYAVLHPVLGPHIFSGNVNVAKFFNRKDIATDSELRAGVGSNPTDNVIMSIVCIGQDAATAVVNFLDVKLRMRVRFMEPKDLTPSTKEGFVVVPPKTTNATPAYRLHA